MFCYGWVGNKAGDKGQGLVEKEEQHSLILMTIFSVGIGQMTQPPSHTLP